MTDNDTINNEKVKELFDSLNVRTAHQYKSYYTKYIQWCLQNNYIQHDYDDDDDSPDSPDSPDLYKNLPLSSQLFHSFILDTIITNNKKNSHEEEFNLSILKKVITSLNFLTKLCEIHNNINIIHINDKYLENLIKLHTSWSEFNSNLINSITLTNNKITCPSIIKISFNLYNPMTLNLNEKLFKTNLEKFRFLVDFHFRNYTNLPFIERSNIKLSQLKSISSTMISIDRITDNSHNPIILTTQDCPFLCPLTSLASYLYLRFYGIKSVYSGDGFPNLDNQSSSSKIKNWLEIPLIRGKSPMEYPRDETLSNHYANVFRYCHLPYKRREYFNQNKIEFPTWSIEEFEIIETQFNQKKAFNDNVPFDYKQIMNFKSPYVSYDSAVETFNLPSESLLVQIFPEIEQYKRHLNILTDDAKQFIQLMETLRNVFVKNLPWIYKLFPNNDIFKDPIFQNSDFQSFFNSIDGNFQNNNNNLPFKILPGIETFALNDVYDILIEPPLHNLKDEKLINITNRNLSPITTPIVLNEKHIIDQSFQFVQYQTLTNFKLLLSLLSKIFDKLDMKRSSREYMIHQLNLLNDTLVDKINISKPDDVETFIETKNKRLKIKQEQEQEQENEIEIEKIRKDKNKKRNNVKNNTNTFGLFDLDTSSDDEDEDDEDFKENNEEKHDENESEVDMQQELKFMINELVGERVRSTFKQHMEQFEFKMNQTINQIVEEKVNTTLHEKLNEFELKLSNINNARNSSTKLNEKRSFDSLDNGYDYNEKRNRSSILSDDLHESTPPFQSNSQSTFQMDPLIDTVEGVILEWFTPNPLYQNNCVHTMNKNHDKSWRNNFTTLYKERKIIVEFYIHLVNHSNFDRYKAVEVCESLRDENDPLSTISKRLKEWKKSHKSSFDGLVENLT